MTKQEILTHIDHTQLKAFCTWENIKKLCDEAIKYNTASVCIPPSYIERIKETYGDKINICTVIGFPLGYNTTETKVFEVKDAIAKGCSEVDVVINIGHVKNSDFDKVEAEIKALKEARALGDLSENADYDAARAEQAQVEGRIQELEKIMENVHIIEKGETDKVSLGTTVKIKYVDDDEIEEYRIVGSKEADPSNNKISNESPIAKAIMNGKVGEIKKVASPNGEYEVEIVAIC